MSTLMRVHKILFFIVSIFLSPLISAAQCDVKIDYAQKMDSGNSYSLFLKAEQPHQLIDAKVKLYDLYLGKIVAEKEITITNKTTEVFSAVKPSLYTIYIETSMCEKLLSLGGIGGIKIGDF